MNKKAKRRAFFVFVLICMAYGAVAIRLNDRLSARRLTEVQHGTAPSGVNLEMPRKAEAPEGTATGVPSPLEVTPVNPSPKERRAGKEDRGLSALATAVVWYAIGHGWLDEEGLIPVRHEGVGTVWKRPLDIVRDGDREGLKEIGRMIGKTNLLAFLSSEGVTVDATMLPEEILLGKGVDVRSDRAEALYRKHVPEERAREFASSPTGRQRVGGAISASADRRKDGPGKMVTG